MPHGNLSHGGSRSVLGGSIKDRVRPANAAELDGIPWLPTLTPAERRRAEATLVVGEAEPGDLVCRVGRSPTYWFGVVEGLLKMSNDSADGGSVTYTGVPPGGWFGEGTVMKREPYRYNIQALRRSLIAGLPTESFHWLLDHSIGFNRFVMNQLNERLGQLPRWRSTGSTTPRRAWRATWCHCSIRCCTPAWARCCASRSRSWRTWWACRASA